jgi:CRISPR-associated protein Cas8a1/Csx13
MPLTHQIHLHQAIRATFIRHNKFYKLGREASESVTISSSKVILKYKKIEWYAHQLFAQQLCDEIGQLYKEYIQIVSWLYLGATVRHARLEKYNKLEEKPEYALVLLFVPVICKYFVLHSNSIKIDIKQPTKYIVVVPEVSNLEISARRAWSLCSLDYLDFHVASLGEAALEYYSLERADDGFRENCQILVYEKINKSSKQRSLTKFEDVNVNAENIFTYQIARQYFQRNRVFFEGKNFIVKVNYICGIIADNLAARVLWWSNFWEIFYQQDASKELAKELTYNRRGLKAMIEQEEEMETYKAFIRAFHEALRKIYAKIYSRTKEGEVPRIEREYERIRGEISRCYDDQSFRDFMSDFLARAGLNSALYTQWKEILPLIMESVSWQKGRNLALLALASYEPVGTPPLDGNQDAKEDSESPASL